MPGMRRQLSSRRATGPARAQLAQEDAPEPLGLRHGASASGGPAPMPIPRITIEAKPLLLDQQAVQQATAAAFKKYTILEMLADEEGCVEIDRPSFHAWP